MATSEGFFAQVDDLIERFSAPTILVSKLVPDDGEVYVFEERQIVVGPLTHWRMMHPGRQPFLSNYSEGARAWRREQRLRRRK